MDSSAQVPIFPLIIMAVVSILLIASFWKVYTKAGYPGWASLVPIYNVIVLLKIAQKPAWWLVLMLIPGVNGIIAIILALSIAKSFGRGAGFGVGLAFLPMVFYPMLAFGDSRYSNA